MAVTADVENGWNVGESESPLIPSKSSSSILYPLSPPPEPVSHPPPQPSLRHKLHLSHNHHLLHQRITTAASPVSPAHSPASPMGETKKKSKPKPSSRPNNYNSNLDGVLWNGNYVTPASRYLLTGGYDPDLQQFDPNQVEKSTNILDPVSGLPLPPRPDGAPVELNVPHLLQQLAASGLPGAESPAEGSSSPRQRSTSPDGGSDEKRPPRPPNKWMLFRCDYLRRLGSLGKDYEGATDVAAINTVWHDADPAVQKYYAELARLTKIAHYKTFPDYKYRPRTKEQKAADEAKAREEKARKKREAMKPPARRGGRKKSADDDDDEDDEHDDGDAPPRRPTSSKKATAKQSRPPPSAEARRAGSRIAETYAPYQTKYYPPSAFGPAAEDDEEEDDEDAKGFWGAPSEGNPQAAPRFSAQDPMYRGLAFDAGPSSSMVPPPQMGRGGQQAHPQVPTLETFSMDPSANLWPTLEQGVSWSGAGPMAYQDQTHWAAAAASSFSTSNTNFTTNNPQLPAYSTWKAPSGNEPEMQLTLPNGAIGMNFDLLLGSGGGSLAPEDLAMGMNLSANNNANTVLTIDPSAMHTPPTNGDPLHVPMRVSFASEAMQHFLENEQQGADGGNLGFWGSLVPTLGSNGDASGGLDADAVLTPPNTTEMADAALPNHHHVEPKIESLSLEDYSHLTGSTGFGALARDRGFMAALGLDVNGGAIDWVNAARKASVDAKNALAVQGWELAEDGRMPKWVGTKEKDEEEQDADRSFGSMVSFGAAEPVVSASLPTPPADHHAEEVQSEYAPPPAYEGPYRPPPGASHFPIRRVGGNWRPPTSRNVSMQSAIVLGSENGWEKPDAQMDDVAPAPPSVYHNHQQQQPQHPSYSSSAASVHQEPFAAQQQRPQLPQLMNFNFPASTGPQSAVTPFNPYSPHSSNGRGLSATYTPSSQLGMFPPPHSRTVTMSTTVSSSAPDGPPPIPRSSRPSSAAASASGKSGTFTKPAMRQFSGMSMAASSAASTVSSVKN